MELAMTKSLLSTVAPEIQTQGSANIDRRAMLAGLAIVAAIAPTATACTSTHPAFVQWRIWNEAQDLADTLGVRAEEAYATLPPVARGEIAIPFDDGYDTVHFLDGGKKETRPGSVAPSFAWLEAHYNSIKPGPRGWDKTLEEYRAEFEAAEAKAAEIRCAAGIDDLCWQINATLDIADAAEDAVANMTSIDPVVIAARLHMAIRERSKKSGIGDTYDRFTVIALRDLLPSLPAEMVDVISPIVRSI
jgi:hypothetical protein